jgi:hypothetical protein
MNAAARMHVILGLAALAILAGPRATAPQAITERGAENMRADSKTVLAHAPQNLTRPEATRNLTLAHSDDRAAQLILDLHNGQTVTMKGIFSKKAVMTEDDFLSLQRATHNRRRAAVLRS